MAAQAGATKPICASGALVDGGAGLRFNVCHAGQAASAFAVRHHGKVYAYLNRCAHRGVELDWEPGQFFDRERQLLVCATHGALYDPSSGACIAGPCQGAALVTVPVAEFEGQVCLAQEDEVNAR